MKKIVSLVGICCGLLIVLFGVLVLCDSFGPDTSLASTAPYSYDSGYASFGADFYTYVSNNAAEAASAARTAAKNVDSAMEFIKTVCGLGLMAFGLFMSCLFAFFYAAFVEPKAAAEAVTEAPAAEELQPDAVPAEAEVPAGEEEIAAE